MRLRLAASLLLLTVFARAEVHGNTVQYTDGGTVLEGYLVLDDTFSGARPGVLVIHDWMGPGDFTRQKANDLARLGYIALAADIYGKGVRPKDAAAASALAGKFKADRALLRSRAKAALDTLLVKSNTDPAKVAVIGFCFGGTAALELARSGAPVAGTVSFHGGLDTPNPLDAEHIRGKVLVLHGADDPHEPPEQLAAFEKEMRDAHVDWQLVKYGGAVHAFTNPDAGNDNSKGAAYNANADRRSWREMKEFFVEVFR
jgi:dienelactone hydrolase